MSDAELPDFSGVVVQLNLGGGGVGDPAVNQCLLEFAEWRKIGERLFLVGRVPEVEATDWVAGRQAGVAWDAVSSYVLFKSRDEYRESIARYKPTLRERFLG